jgi:hypothetical protein
MKLHAAKRTCNTAYTGRIHNIHTYFFTFSRILQIAEFNVVCFIDAYFFALKKGIQTSQKIKTNCFGFV